MCFLFSLPPMLVLNGNEARNRWNTTTFRWKIFRQPRRVNFESLSQQTWGYNFDEGKCNFHLQRNLLSFSQVNAQRKYERRKKSLLFWYMRKPNEDKECVGRWVMHQQKPSLGHSCKYFCLGLISSSFSSSHIFYLPSLFEFQMMQVFYIVSGLVLVISYSSFTSGYWIPDKLKKKTPYICGHTKKKFSTVTDRMADEVKVNSWLGKRANNLSNYSWKWLSALL